MELLVVPAWPLVTDGFLPCSCFTKQAPTVSPAVLCFSVFPFSICLLSLDICFLFLLLLSYLLPGPIKSLSGCSQFNFFLFPGSILASHPPQLRPSVANELHHLICLSEKSLSLVHCQGRHQVQTSRGLGLKLLQNFKSGSALLLDHTAKGIFSNTGSFFLPQI